MVSTQELNRRLLNVLERDSTEVCLSFIDAWGGPSQILTAIEELSELIKELARWEARGVKEDTYDKLVDEMSDTFVVFHQMMVLMETVFGEDVHEDIQNVAAYKMQRTFKKLPSEMR